jgi:hypothetical protein
VFAEQRIRFVRREPNPAALAAATAGRRPLMLGAVAQKPHCGGNDRRISNRWGKRMRSLLAVLTVALLVALSASAGAQGLGAGMTQPVRDHDRREGGAAPPQEKHAPRANEKDYKSSLGRLPDKKYDPWANTR